MEMTQKELKSKIRKEIMAIRKALPLDQATDKSAKVLENIKSTSLLDANNHIMAFMDFRNEVQTKKIIEYLWSIGKSVYIPLVDNSTMTITVHKISDFNDMSMSSFGIQEPNPEKTPAVDPAIIELILAPGVAFGRDGYRVGYGAGMYDKMLSMSKKQPMVAALSFDLQILDTVPHEDHDVKMDFIITESEIHDCR